MRASDTSGADINAEQGFEVYWNRAGVVLQCLIGLVVAAGLSGLLGDGPLANAQAKLGSPDLALSYHWILRDSEPFKLRLDWPNDASDTRHVKLGYPFLQEVSLSGISPRPERMTSDASGVDYQFRTQPGVGGEIEFSFAARRMGWLTSDLQVDGRSLRLDALVLP